MVYIFLTHNGYKKRILIVVGHPDKKSFCWNGIYKTATRQMRKHKQSYRVIDLYSIIL